METHPARTQIRWTRNCDLAHNRYSTSLWILQSASREHSKSPVCWSFWYKIMDQIIYNIFAHDQLLVDEFLDVFVEIASS